MSACNILLQRRHKAVHMMVDGVAYDKDGTIVEVMQKCVALPTLHMAVTVMGPTLGGLVMAAELQKRFASFDDLVDGIETVMPALFKSHLGLLSGSGIPDCRVYLAGWSERRAAPAAYSMNCVPAESEAYWQMANQREAAEFGADMVVADVPFHLVELDGAIINPPPAPDLSFADCGLSFAGAADDIPDLMDPEHDLLTVLEMQRRRKVPVRPGEEPAHWVGGLALLTSITQAGISQRVVHRWPDDVVGGKIEPAAIDWQARRRARQAPVGNLSWLQRKRLEKKAARC